MKNCIKYNSTRGGDINLSFEEVLLNGLAKDGGLYMPNKWPNFSIEEISKMRNLDYISLAEKVITPFVGESLRDKIGCISAKVYKKFSHIEKAPLVSINKNLYVMELFHGPTFAFKDYAMQFLSELFDEVLLKTKGKSLILGATSGDTGSAAIAALKEKKI